MGLVERKLISSRTRFARARIHCTLQRDKKLRSITVLRDRLEHKGGSLLRGGCIIKKGRKWEEKRGRGGRWTDLPMVPRAPRPVISLSPVPYLSPLERERGLSGGDSKGCITQGNRDFKHPRRKRHLQKYHFINW